MGSLAPPAPATSGVTVTPAAIDWFICPEKGRETYQGFDAVSACRTRQDFKEKNISGAATTASPAKKSGLTTSRKSAIRQDKGNAIRL
jgi:hypothetical protein